MLFTKDEATAAQRTRTAYLVDVTDGFTPEPTLDLTTAGDIQISKNGGAFANWAGTVTEVAVGVYKLVYAAADLDTLGSLTTKITDAAARVVMLEDQVIALDMNVATMAPTAGSIVAASFGAGAIDAAAVAADAVTEVQNGLATAAGVAAIDVATRTATVGLGTRTTDGNFTAKSMDNAIKTEITVTGTWDGATVTAQVCQDPTAAVPAWVDKGTPITANGVITVTGPAKAVRAVLSNDGATTSLTATAAIVSAGI